MKKPSSNKFTFGWSRAEILGSVINCVFSLALCFTIIIGAIDRYIKPEPLQNIELVLYVGGAGLALNVVSLFLFWIQEKFTVSDDDEDGDDEDGADVVARSSYDNRAAEFDDVEKADDSNKDAKNQKKTTKKKASDNMNMKAVFLNALADSLGSVAVVISGILILYVPPKGFEDAKWKMYMDPTLSLLIAGIMITAISPLLKKSSLIILQTVSNKLDYSKIKMTIESIKGVTSIHHFHIWSLNSKKMVASAHVCVSKDANEQDRRRILNSVIRILHSNNVHSTTIQLEDDALCLDSCANSMCPKDSKCCDQAPKTTKVNGALVQF